MFLILAILLLFPSFDLTCKEKCHEEVSYDDNGKAHLTGSMVCDGGVFDNCHEDGGM